MGNGNGGREWRRNEDHGLLRKQESEEVHVSSSEPVMICCRPSLNGMRTG